MLHNYLLKNKTDTDTDTHTLLLVSTSKLIANNTIIVT